MGSLAVVSGGGHRVVFLVDHIKLQHGRFHPTQVVGKLLEHLDTQTVPGNVLLNQINSPYFYLLILLYYLAITDIVTTASSLTLSTVLWTCASFIGALIRGTNPDSMVSSNKTTGSQPETVTPIIYCYVNLTADKL